MNIVYLLRMDGQTKPGGDTTKAQRFCHHIGLAGHQTEIQFGRPSGPPPDLVHLVNLDLPLENGRLLYQARRMWPDARVAISTVHHPFDGIGAYYASELDRFFRATKRLGIPWEASVTFREWMKLLRRTGRPTGNPLASTRTYQRKLLTMVDLALPMAPGEERTLFRDLGEVDTQMAIVPNGQSFPTEKQEEGSSRTDDHVVVVGRVEPRKNSVAAALALRDAGINATFIGAKNTNHSAFCSLFQSIVDSAQNLNYLGPLPHADLQEVLRTGTHYVNPSFFEVVSQADVEAASLGLRVVTTKWSFLPDVLGASNFSTVDPSALLAPEGATILADALSSAPVPELPPLPTWETASDTLLAAYGKVVLE